MGVYCTYVYPICEFLRYLSSTNELKRFILFITVDLPDHFSCSFSIGKKHKFPKTLQTPFLSLQSYSNVQAVLSDDLFIHV